MTAISNVQDVIGELSAMRSTISDGMHGSQRVMLTLRVEGCVLLLKLNVVCDCNDSMVLV